MVITSTVGAANAAIGGAGGAGLAVIAMIVATAGAAIPRTVITGFTRVHIALAVTAAFPAIHRASGAELDPPVALAITTTNAAIFGTTPTVVITVTYAIATTSAAVFGTRLAIFYPCLAMAITAAFSTVVWTVETVFVTIAGSIVAAYAGAAIGRAGRAILQARLTDAVTTAIAAIG
jgi:hypothetical protein